MGSYNKSVKWIEGLSPESVRRLTSEARIKAKVKREQEEANENINLMTTKWRHQEIHRKLKELLKS